MKLSNFYCETKATKYCAEPKRGGPACIFAVQGNEDCIVLMTSANLNNLYCGNGGALTKSGLKTDYMRIDGPKQMKELFGESKSKHLHLTLEYFDSRSVVILYKGKVKQKGTLSVGDEPLTMDDLVALTRDLGEAGLITRELKEAVLNEVSSRLRGEMPKLVTHIPGGPSVVDSEGEEAKESQASSSSAFFAPKKQYEEQVSQMDIEDESNLSTPAPGR